MTEIIVTGRRHPTSAVWDGRIIMEDCEAWGDFWSWWENESGQVPPMPTFETHPPNYTPVFDKVFDKAVDKAAKAIGLVMQMKADIDKVEYSSIIWKDSSGNVRTTEIFKGTNTQAPLDRAWAQVDFASGGKVVAIIHSHPSLQNTGSEQNPIWTPLPDSWMPSAIDFNKLLEYSGRISSFNAVSNGFDPNNYRSYIFSETGGMREFYGFDQDIARYGDGGQATWSVSSTDYGVNAYGPD